MNSGRLVEISLLSSLSLSSHLCLSLALSSHVGLTLSLHVDLSFFIWLSLHMVWCGVVWCVWCVCGVCVCGVCVVCHAHMLKHMCAWCRYTRRRFERTHGGVLNLHTVPLLPSPAPHPIHPSANTHTQTQHKHTQQHTTTHHSTTQHAQAISCSNVRGVFPFHEHFWFYLVQVSTTSVVVSHLFS